MAVDINIPSPGESITEVVVGPWQKQPGEWVEKDEIIVEIESDKVTLELPAPESGVLQVQAVEGEDKQVGDVIGTVDPSAERPAASAAAQGQASAISGEGGPVDVLATHPTAATLANGDASHKATSVARKVAQDKGVDLSGVTGTGSSGRITKSDVLAVAGSKPSDVTAVAPSPAQRSGTLVQAPSMGSRNVRTQRMSKLRQRIAERLVAAQHAAAMLTTFNEADMTAVMTLRKAHKEEFEKMHGVGLGFMSFFIKACVSALQQYQGVNAYIAGDQVEYHDFVDISVAVGTDRGLVVPVLRNAETMSFAEIEQNVKALALKARDGKLTIEEMSGGTFTISNGGVYGSLMSTPILNAPQSGILGMHKIMKRAVEDPDNPGQLTLRPMMYLALSYDHRVVDGEQAVRFLVHVKDSIENPQRLLLGL